MDAFTTGNTVTVTGGAQGIGLYICRALINRGYAVIMVDRDEQALEEAARQFPEDVLIPWKADVAEEQEVKTLFSSLQEQKCRLAGIVNNAGIADNRPIGMLSLHQWRRVIDTNLTSVFLTAKYGTPLMDRGSIVSIASTRALMSEADTEAYSASKGGIVALTHALAVSLGPQIRVNAISPGWIDVSGAKKSGTCKQLELSKEDHLQHPAGRVGKPEDIAEMTVFLVSEKAGFITGENIIIDGGMTRKMIYH